jgi:hypothetical protein
MFAVKRALWRTFFTDESAGLLERDWSKFVD